MARRNGYDTLRTVIRARAPLRLGLAGGGTDLSPYCENHGGAVLNCTIDKYAYAFASSRDDGKVVFRAGDLGIEETFPLSAVIDSKLALHAGVYRHFVKEFHQGVPFAVTITTNVDAPAGSGLGSSSALVVALVDVLRAYLNLPLGPYDVAHLAFAIERIDLGFAGNRTNTPRHSAA